MEPNKQSPRRTPAERSSQSASGRPRQPQPARKKSTTVSGTFGGTLSYVLLIVGISLILSAIAISIANDMFALVKGDQTVMLELTEEKSAGQVGKILEENGLIKYNFWFSIFAKLKDATTFDKGKFELNETMDYGQMIDTLRRVATYREVVDITIPEGYNLTQIAQVLEDTRVCSGTEFLKTANTYEFSHEILKDVPMVDNRLEGYLFPDTYQFYVSDKPVNVINKMLNNFVNKYSKEMLKLTTDKKITIAEVVNIASLIEREARLPDEQTKISGVIRNRLNSDKYPLLNIDATILYVVGHKEQLTSDDLKVDSPYNTYLYKGLPPTAICNPGTSAMLAAISPEKHGYYFYVADPETGGHVFSKTLEEHNANVKKMAGKAK